MEAASSINANSLFVDASGWLAYLDKSDVNHGEAVKKIHESVDAVLTTEHELAELSRIARSQISDVAIASLTWQLWNEQGGKILKVAEEDELLAWNIFCIYEDLQPSFANCISSVILNKYKIKHRLSFNEWLPRMIKQAKRITGSRPINSNSTDVTNFLIF